MALKIRRGTETQRASIRFEMGELVWTTDTYRLYVGDGSELGGHNIAKNLAGTGMAFNPGTNRLDVNFNGLNSDNVAEGSNNLFFTNERGQDAAGLALVQGNQYNSGITFVYDDVNNRVTASISVGAGLPIQTSNNGKFLTTNGINPSWVDISAFSLPTQSGNNGKFLTTDGSSSFWSNLPSPGIAAVVNDATPLLGGNLGLNGRNITGTGNINISGSVTSTSVVTGGLSFSSTASITGTTINEVGVVHNFVTSTPSATQHVSLLSASTDAVSGPLTFGKARGSLLSPSAVTSGDSVVKIIASAFTGSAFTSIGEISCKVSGTVSSGVAPSEWTIKSQSSIGGEVTALTINGASATFGVVPVVPSFANSTVRDSSIPTPTVGMVVVTNSVFEGYNGTAWVTLG